MHMHRNICKLYIYLSMLTGLLLQEKIYKLFLGLGLGLRARLRSWELPQAIQRPYSSSPFHLSQVVSMNQNSPQVVFVIYSSSSIP